MDDAYRWCTLPKMRLCARTCKVEITNTEQKIYPKGEGAEIRSFPSWASIHLIQSSPSYLVGLSLILASIPASHYYYYWVLLVSTPAFTAFATPVSAGWQCSVESPTAGLIGTYTSWFASAMSRDLYPPTSGEQGKHWGFRSCGRQHSHCQQKKQNGTERHGAGHNQTLI